MKQSVYRHTERVLRRRAGGRSSSHQRSSSLGLGPGAIIVNVNNGIQYIPGNEFTSLMGAPPSYSEIDQVGMRNRDSPPPMYSTIDRHPVRGALNFDDYVIQGSAFTAACAPCLPTLSRDSSVLSDSESYIQIQLGSFPPMQHVSVQTSHADNNDPTEVDNQTNQTGACIGLQHEGEFQCQDFTELHPLMIQTNENDPDVLHEQALGYSAMCGTLQCRMGEQCNDSTCASVSRQREILPSLYRNNSESPTDRLVEDNPLHMSDFLTESPQHVITQGRPNSVSSRSPQHQNSSRINMSHSPTIRDQNVDSASETHSPGIRVPNVDVSHSPRIRCGNVDSASISPPLKQPNLTVEHGQILLAQGHVESPTKDHASCSGASPAHLRVEAGQIVLGDPSRCSGGMSDVGSEGNVCEGNESH